eukprot:g30431.t1
MSLETLPVLPMPRYQNERVLRALRWAVTSSAPGACRNVRRRICQRLRRKLGHCLPEKELLRVMESFKTWQDELSPLAEPSSTEGQSQVLLDSPRTGGAAAMFLASMLGYHELMFPLAQTLRNIITHQNLNFPVSLFEISLLEASSTAHRAPSHALSQLTSLLGNPELPAHLRLACERQVAALEQRTPADEWSTGDGPGLLKLAGSHLPSCYKKYAKTSVLTNQLIRGPAFELEEMLWHVLLCAAVISW